MAQEQQRLQLVLLGGPEPHMFHVPPICYHGGLVDPNAQADADRDRLAVRFSSSGNINI